VQRQIAFVTEAVAQGLIFSCHDISDGGLLLSLFEMLTPQRRQKTGLGLEIDLQILQSSLPIDKILFSETGGFVMEVQKKHTSSLQALAWKHRLTLFEIGKTSTEPHLEVAGVCSFEISKLLGLWEASLQTLLSL